MVGPHTIEPQHEHQRPSQSTVTELAIDGMTCGNCARHVAEALQSVSGVRAANVSLDARAATVRWEPTTNADVNALMRAVAGAGYSARLMETHAHEHGEPKVAGWHLNLWIGVLGTAPLMIGEWVFRLGMAPWFQWFSFVLAAVVQVLAGAQFYRGAWRQLKLGSSNMDTLVALGSSTAFGYSVWALLSGPGSHLYFMEAAAIITLVSLGHWMEAQVSKRASSALQSLLELAPQTARKLNTVAAPAHEPQQKQTLDDGPLTPSPSPSEGERVPKAGEGRIANLARAAEFEVPVSELKAGDLVLLRPGDRVPTDGIVVEGDSAVDESMLTGESVPVDKTTGTELYAGTVNLNGRLVMRVTATGEATALAHIIAAVQRAQSSRANIQRLGDSVSSVFVPVVVLVALAAGLWWGFAPESAHHVHDWLARFLWAAHPPGGALAAGFIIAAAVLIIACPCAMGLATPAAIMASANAAAQRGILIRDGVALEKAGQVTAVIFDKTGTLTLGKPTVAHFEIFNGDGAKTNEAVGLAAALASHSSHPISQAVNRISPNGFQLLEWREVRGAGVQGKLQRSEASQLLARLGSLRWLRESGVDLASGEQFVREWSAQGATIVGLAVEKQLRGLFAVKDTVKSGARQVVEKLHAQGLKTYLVTGDNALTAASIAQQVAIGTANVSAEVRPEQKAEFVRKLQQQGERVAFVGDGINDAPALEQANLGVAVGRASDIAREAADIILLKSEIEAVPEALGLARATLRTIKQNLFWAFFYNAVGVPLAALGFMSPILCAAAMGLSDLVVIGNALRLRAWR